ncbi:hypothetical protein CRE_11791 [Caenorhabditis remanei]|uniref:Uncharacterized protein n=1 Tax=Caenorhabditis remanei TaxID=31234 RepID=E3M4P8_CAERE|nr:hypothetical protein CRE_11791 [Caenorhabditis remanei]
MYHGGTASWRLFWTQNIPLLDIHLKPLYYSSQFLRFFFSINFNCGIPDLCLLQVKSTMLSVSDTLPRTTTIPSAETVISPIELEMIRDEQNKEIFEQRRLMKQRNGGLQCYLASQTEERQYLVSKLNEAQEKQKIEKHLIMKNLPRSDTQQKTIDKLASELEEQTNEGKHLMECIKGETRHAIDVAQLLKTSNENM